MKNKINFVYKVKILTIFILFFILFLPTFANADYINDYTLIDCINGDDSNGVAFDSEKPYQTLKGGIEKTIDYINANINKAGNQETASGKVFNIKIECSINDILNSQINLNFDGNTYKNELVIEGISDNSFIIKNSILYIPNGKGNIKIINANFLPGEKYNYYIKSQEKYKLYESPGIKILNSYIKLGKNYNIGNSNRYTDSFYISNAVYYTYYSNQQIIESSIIDIEIDGNYTFVSPVLIKNTKINFQNLSGSGLINNINFSYNSNEGNTSTKFFSLISNEINLGGNNFSVISSINALFINNLITNFNGINFGVDSTFINNLVENNSSINISASKNLFNNVFKSGFTDTYDIFNYRKNYHIDNIGPKGIGWVYKRNHIYNYFDLDINSSSLYKEVTGNDIPNGLGEIYVIFNF